MSSSRCRTNPGTYNSAVGESASLQIQASGLPSGDTWFYSATGLPSGLSINTSSGLISGKLSAAPGGYAVSVTSGDGQGASCRAELHLERGPNHEHRDFENPSFSIWTSRDIHRHHHTRHERVRQAHGNGHVP